MEDTVSKQEKPTRDPATQEYGTSNEGKSREDNGLTRDVPEESPEIRIVSQGREKIVPTQQFAEETEKSYPLILISFLSFWPLINRYI